MKIILVFIGIASLCLTTYSQTYKSEVATITTPTYTTERKDRVISISDKEISISKFFKGDETLYLIVNRIENKKFVTYGMCKTYYCTTKDKDPIWGYEKAIVRVQTGMDITVVLFADDMTFLEYSYQL